MKILIIDNNIVKDSWGCENLRQFARKVPGATVAVRRAPQDDLPASPRDFDRIVVSGSLTGAVDDAPWIDHLLEFIRRAVEAKKPYLGVCYGHQMLARALGGKAAVRRAARAEFGWTRIIVKGKSPILNGLPSEFYSFSSHQDEVAAVPAGARVVAESDRCAVQSFLMEDAPAFGIQFHPEKLLPECERAFVNWKKDFKPRDTLQPTRGKSLYEPKIGETIFRNFFEL
jgi:GMP synthase-like glutamine amidotransferase